MKEQKVFFKNNKGQKLAGILTIPGKKSKTAILVCHGFTSHMQRNYHSELSKKIAESGYASLRFDFTGNGESEGEFSEGTASQEIKDISSAIDFLETKGYNNFGVEGHSMGGGVVIGAGAEDKRIKAICSISPSIRYHTTLSIKRYGIQNLVKLQTVGYFIFKKENGREFKITKDFVRDKKLNNFLKRIGGVNVPILIIHGTNDVTVKIDEGKDLFEKAKNPKEFLAIGGADHNFTDYNHRQVMINSAVTFFKRHLK
jgi:esterase/lipase